MKKYILLDSVLAFEMDFTRFMHLVVGDQASVLVATDESFLVGFDEADGVVAGGKVHDFGDVQRGSWNDYGFDYFILFI